MSVGFLNIFFFFKAEALQSLFIALNDESFSIRRVAMEVIGRLAVRNPAHVMPSLRKTLIQLLTELQCSKNATNRKQSADLLGMIILFA